MQGDLKKCKEKSLGFVLEWKEEKDEWKWLRKSKDFEKTNHIK